MPGCRRTDRGRVLPSQEAEVTTYRTVPVNAVAQQAIRELRRQPEVALRSLATDPGCQIAGHAVHTSGDMGGVLACVEPRTGPGSGRT